MVNFINVFGFLFDLRKLKALGKSELQEHCTNFHKTNLMVMFHILI